MNKIIVLFYFLLLSLGLSAQGESDWWYFDDYAGVHFTEDTVVAVFDNSMGSAHHSSTLSDEDGNLLFYSNGGSVYSSDHEFMENGEDINNFSGNSSVAVRIGLNDSIYHLFSLGYTERVNYRTVNINTNDGLGFASDTVELPGSEYFYITATKKSNGIDYWIVCREKIGNRYISYSLTEDGLDSENPVYSYAGDDFNPVSGLTSSGSLRINPQGNLLAFALVDEATSFGNNYGRCELFSFNNETGEVEERVVKMNNTNVPTQNANAFEPYNTEFSPDGEKMYISGSWIFQCNIALLDSTSIVQSMIRFNDFQTGWFLKGMQLAKDGRIYIGNVQSTWLSVIHHPNTAGFGAGFSFNGLDLSPNYSGHFLPNFDPTLFSSGFKVSDRCANAETQFSLIYEMDYSYIHWDFGDGSSSIEWEPTHSYASPGSYQVELTSVIGNDTSIKAMEVIIEGQPSADLGLDGTLVCDGDSLVLDASFYAAYYTWQDNSYQPTYTVTDEGEYYVEVKNICGQASDTIRIELDKEELDIGEDTLICSQEPLILLANQSNAYEWLWQDGSTLPFYEAESEGEYHVLVSTPCFLIYDSIHVYTEDCGLIVPNIITPNEDGINDYFKIINLDMLGYQWSLKIYNRWGKQVYYNENYNNSWNAYEQSDGVYFYIIQSKNTIDSYKGSVSVVRE